MLALGQNFLSYRYSLDRKGGGSSTATRVDRRDWALEFKTQISDFPTLCRTKFRFSRLCLRHLTQNHTHCGPGKNAAFDFYKLNYTLGHVTIFLWLIRSGLLDPTYTCSIFVCGPLLILFYCMYVFWTFL